LTVFLLVVVASCKKENIDFTNETIYNLVD